MVLSGVCFGACGVVCVNVHPRLVVVGLPTLNPSLPFIPSRPFFALDLYGMCVDLVHTALCRFLPDETDVGTLAPALENAILDASDGEGASKLNFTRLNENIGQLSEVQCSVQRAACSAARCGGRRFPVFALVGIMVGLVRVKTWVSFFSRPSLRTNTLLLATSRLHLGPLPPQPRATPLQALNLALTVASVAPALKSNFRGAHLRSFAVLQPQPFPLNPDDTVASVVDPLLESN